MASVGYLKDYCWVVTYSFNNIGAPYIVTCEKRYDALDFCLPVILKKLKSMFKRVTWEEENLDKLKNTKISEYGMKASGNPNIYVKVYKSYWSGYWEVDGQKLPGFKNYKPERKDL